MGTPESPLPDDQPEELTSPNVEPPFDAAMLASIVARQPPRVSTVFGAYLVALLLVVLIVPRVVLDGLIFFGASADPLSVDNTSTVMLATPEALLSLAAVSALMVAGIGIVGGWLSPVPLRARLRLGSSTRSGFATLVALIGVIAVNYMAIGLDGLGLLPGGNILMGLADPFVPMPMDLLPLNLLVAGLGMGVGEEIFFRGYMQTRLSRRWGLWPGVMVTALLCGILQFDPVHGLFAFGMATVLGLLVEKSGSIRPAVICHVLCNVWIVLDGRFVWSFSLPIPRSLLALVGLFVFGRAMLYLGNLSSAEELEADVSNIVDEEFGLPYGP